MDLAWESGVVTVFKAGQGKGELLYAEEGCKTRTKQLI
jgi:hypothetical protein